MIQADLIVEGAAELLTLAGNTPQPRRGAEMRDLGILRRGALAARREALERTLAAWKTADLEAAARRALAWLPATARIRARVYPVIKPRHNSFVFELDSDPAIFLYLDPEVSAPHFENTLAHELHHVGLHSISREMEAGIARLPEPARRAAEDPQAGAIAGRMAAEHYGLSVLAGSIEDDPNNTTRFVVVGNQEIAPSGRDKTSFVMASQNRPGAIFDLLEPLARNRVSMTRLESRPSRTGLWEYVFFVDIEGHQQDATVERALGEIRERAGFLKILGSYPVVVA